MIDFSDIEKFLPQYLSKKATENLFAELKNFPDNVDNRLYTNFLANNPIIYQGDGLGGLLSINLPDPKVAEIQAIILSNTCDVDISNERLFESRLVFATIIQLAKYKNLLIKKYVEKELKTIEQIDEHIEQIKKQYISNMFYLPKSGQLENDSIALLDRTNNLPHDFLQDHQILSQRLFTLSDYGFYLFLYKISIHFTRVRENVQRNDFQDNLVH